MKKILRYILTGLLTASIIFSFNYPEAAAKGKASGNIIVDGIKINFTIPVDDTSLFAPADLIYPALGATYKVSKKKGIAKVTLGLKSFEIREGSYDFTVKDRMIIMGVAAYFRGNQLMVPLRSIAESVGGGVRWDGKFKVWQVYSRNTLEAMIDIMGDGTTLKDKLASYEQYFTDEHDTFWSALRDGASIYRSDVNGENPERLLDAATRIIGIDKENIYYINISEQNHLYRMKKDGTHQKLLESGSVFNPVMKNGTIEYYSLDNALSYCSVTTDGKEKKTINNEVTVMDGDWVIKEDTTISGKTILLKGDLIVNGGCTLSLDNTNLVFDTGKDVESQVTPRKLKLENAALFMKNCALLSTRQDNGIDFTVKASKLKVENCRISNILREISVDHCKDVVFRDNYVINNSQSGFVNDGRSENTLCERNIVISKDKDPWITFFVGNDSIIRDNVCVNQGECYFIQYGSSGKVINNLFLGDHYWLGLSLRHDAGNSLYDNNFLQYNYDDGYKISDAGYSNAITSDTLDSTTTYTRNVVNNASLGIQMNNMSNCVYDSNRIWTQLYDTNSNRSKNVAVNMQYAHHNEIINNTFESWNGGGGLEAFYCTGNHIEGNTFTGYKYGIELWNNSDNNSILGNKLEDCNSNILLNSSKNNKVQQNTLLSTKSYQINIYNNGDNEWSSNYYSDWKSSAPRPLPGKGKDSSPLTREPSLTKAKTEYPAVIFDMNRLTSNYGQMESDGVIATSKLWKDMTINYISHDFRILSGATLTMENVTLNSPSMYNSEPEMYVKNGASLILKNCKILCNPLRMSITLRVEGGGTLIAENCTFEGMEGIEIAGAKASFKNCTFVDCYNITNFNSNGSMEMINCNITDCFSGIDSFSVDGSKISGNTLTNVVLKFPEPVLIPVSK